MSEQSPHVWAAPSPRVPPPPQGPAGLQMATPPAGSQLMGTDRD